MHLDPLIEMNTISFMVQVILIPNANVSVSTAKFVCVSQRDLYTSRAGES